MTRSNLTRYAYALLVGFVTLCLGWILTGGSRSDRSTSTSAGRGVRPGSVVPLQPESGLESPRTVENPVRVASLAPRSSAEMTPDNWSTMAPRQRIRELEHQFKDAFGDLEGGDESAKDRASDALTALRFELYGTVAGRRRQAELERRLDELGGDV